MNPTRPQLGGGNNHDDDDDDRMKNDLLKMPRPPGPCLVLAITRSGGLTVGEGRFSVGHRCRRRLRRRRRRRRRREDRHKQTWAQATDVGNLLRSLVLVA